VVEECPSQWSTNGEYPKTPSPPHSAWTRSWGQGQGTLLELPLSLSVSGGWYRKPSAGSRDRDSEPSRHGGGGHRGQPVVFSYR